jgi:hypothetical protein
LVLISFGTFFSEIADTMSGLRSVVKEGWHPKSKEGKAESWRGDFKGIGQVVSLKN